jgi:proteasome accessory factor B
VTAKVERLVNLTVALLEARAPMSLGEIRRRTGYYRTADPASGRRMFERDKDDLRRLGVPVETRTLVHGEEQGYLVPRDAYELPDVDLTGEEVAALALAVRVTGAEGTPLALAKLAARAPDPAELSAAAATRVELEPEAVEDVAELVLQRVPVRFRYRTADGTTGSRTVDAYGVVQRRAAWYLVGRDHDRDAVRAFRLDRMQDRPEPVGPPGAFELPSDLDVAAAVRGPEFAGVTVELAVSPYATWTIELRGGRDTGRRTDDGWPIWELDGLHPVRDRSWVLGLGADVEVLAPPELRRSVVEALRTVAATAGTDAP